MVDPDETLPPEPITAPGMARGLLCPACHGHRYVAGPVRAGHDGTLEHGVIAACSTCSAAGRVDRTTFQRWLDSH